MTVSRPDKHRPHQVEVIAHRGTPMEAPENSLPGFQRALELGAQGIELDVHLTADDVLVVHHDALVRGPRTGLPDGHAAYEAATGTAIRDLTHGELREYPLAPGVAIPTLRDVLDLVGDRAVVYVELKAPGAEQWAVRAVREHRAHCAIHSFDHRVALRVSALAPEIATGILLASYLLDPASALRAARARDYWQAAELIDAELVDRVQAAGGRVIAWTVNSANAATRLDALGVDGVCTDVCGALRDALARPVDRGAASG